MQALFGIKPEATRTKNPQTVSGKGSVAIREFARIRYYTKVNPTHILLGDETDG